MIYYGVPLPTLTRELHRRRFHAYGGPDEVSETLQSLDEAGGSDATTVRTVPMRETYRPMEEVSLMRPKSNPWGYIGVQRMELVKELRPRTTFGKTVDTRLLLGECITYWTLNTFFPTLQLHFESGLSCTVEGGALSNSVMGMDNALLTRLTDISHEQNGRVYNSIIPATPSCKGKSSAKCNAEPGIRIMESTMARRTSVAVKQVVVKGTRTATIVNEEHFVVGLRLEGMSAMGFVWARVDRHEVGVSIERRTWGDVRVAGLTDVGENAALPYVKGEREGIGLGGVVTVVEKEARAKELGNGYSMVYR